MRTENPISQELRIIRSMNLGDKQKFAYDWMDKHYEEVKISTLSELPKDLQESITKVKNFLALEINQCYKNASTMLLYAFLFSNYQVHYIEGKVTCLGIPIDHAWVKFISDGGESYYFDPTIELVLERNPNENLYVKFIELNRKELLDILLESEMYGPYLHYITRKEYEKVND